MGCDIHQYAEYRKGGEWIAEEKASYIHTPAGEKGPDGEVENYDQTEMANSGNRSRNYGLFGLLAGVRYETPHSFVTQGAPGDMSEEVEQIVAQWDGDGHSHSYLTFQELKEKAAEMMLAPDTDAQEYRSMLPAWINSFGPNPEGVSDEDRRVVFFFDN